MIGNDAHGVNRFARAACGNDNARTRERTVARENLLRHRNDFVRFCHASFALRAGREIARVRFNHKHAALFQRFQILLRGGMFPHARFHRGREQDGRARIERNRADDIICQSLREFRDGVGSRGRDDDHARAFCKRDVFDFRICRERQNVAQDGIVRERCKSQRSHKLRGGIRHGDMHLRAELMQAARQRRAFVRGNAARNAENDNVILKKVHV